MLSAVRATGGPGEAVDHDPAAGPAGRWPAGTAALAQTTLVLPNVRLPAQVVHRAGRAGPGLDPGSHPVAAGGRGGGRRRRPHDRAGRPRPRLSWPVVADAVAAHAARVLPAEPAPVTVLGIDQVRRGKPRWVYDEQAGSWTTTADRWHIGFCDLSGGQGLLAQVEGRTTATVTGLPAARPQAWRDQVRAVAIDSAPSSRPPSGRCCHTRCWWSTTSISCNWPTGPLPRSAVGPP
jgi:hypothetical protein